VLLEKISDVSQINKIKSNQMITKLNTVLDHEVECVSYQLTNETFYTSTQRLSNDYLDDSKCLNPEKDEHESSVVTKIIKDEK